MLSPSLTLSHRLRRPYVVGWALLVALLGAFAVPLAHAGTGMAAVGGIEVCTGNGTQTITLDSGTGRELIPYLAHCPFCLHSLDRLAPPPHRLGLLFAPAASQPAPALGQPPAVAPQCAAVPPPRGPPCVS